MTGRMDCARTLVLAILIGAAAASASPAAAAKSRGGASALYTVKPGDTLYDLADRYLLRLDDYREVQRLNRVWEPRRLPVGVKLQIPVRLLRTKAIDARLGAYRGSVTITSAGRAATVAIGLVLREGDVVATGANAFARLDLPDGSRVAIPSQSRVRIDRLRWTLLTAAADREFTVEAGRSESSVIPLHAPQDRYIVRTPLSVSAVRGTEFHVSYEPAERQAATEVLRGVVAVSADRRRKATTLAGYGVTVGAQGALAPAPLAVAPELLRPEKMQDQPQLAFDVAPAADVRAYRLRLAADAGFVDTLAETTAQEPHFTFDGLGDGDYFVRVSVIGQDGLEGMPRTYAFRRFLNTIDLFRPSVTGARRQRRCLFRWTTSGGGERTFRFQLYRDAATSPLVDELGLTEPQITLTDLPPGAYVWRVMSRAVAAGRSVDKWSLAERFVISR